MAEKEKNRNETSFASTGGIDNRQHRHAQANSVARLRYKHYSFHMDFLVDSEESYLPSLSFSFPICKMATITVPDSEIVVKVFSNMSTSGP